MALKVNVERAKAASRARNSVWEDPTQADVADPEDYDEEDPRIYAPCDADAADAGPELSDFKDYGDSFDWSSVSGAVADAGFPGPEASATWLPTRVAQVRATGTCEGITPRSGDSGAVVNPYDANPEQRFQIALVLKTIQDWVYGIAGYKQLRLLTAGVAGTGKSFVIHALTSLVRKLLGFEGAAKVFAPTGVAAFQVGGSTGHRLLRVPTGKTAFGQLETLKGERCARYRKTSATALC